MLGKCSTTEPDVFVVGLVGFGEDGSRGRVALVSLGPDNCHQKVVVLMALCASQAEGSVGTCFFTSSCSITLNWLLCQLGMMFGGPDISPCLTKIC